MTPSYIYVYRPSSDSNVPLSYVCKVTVAYDNFDNKRRYDDDDDDVWTINCD